MKKETIARTWDYNNKREETRANASLFPYLSHWKNASPKGCVKLNVKLSVSTHRSKPPFFFYNSFPTRV